MPSTVDRFYAAVTVLAGEGRMKQRLLKAYSDNLTDVDEDDLPVTVREPFADLRRRMREVPPLNGESYVCASIRKMSKRDASDCASVIVDIYGQVLKQPTTLTLPTNKEEQADVPAFLVKTAS